MHKLIGAKREESHHCRSDHRDHNGLFHLLPVTEKIPDGSRIHQAHEHREQDIRKYHAVDSHMESQRHDLKCDQMEDKGDHRVKDRKTHFVDSLKDRVRHRRDGVKYDRKRTVDRHPDRQGIISREQQVIHRSRKYRKSHSGRDRHKAGETDRRCHALSHKLFVSHRHCPGYGRDQGGRKGIGNRHRHIDQQMVFSCIHSPDGGKFISLSESLKVVCEDPVIQHAV